MRPVLSVAEMREVDATAQATTDLDTLVARAGTAVATQALGLLGGAYGRRVVVVAGPGNNGADGRVAAGILARRGARVRVLEAKEAPPTLPVADLVVDAAFGTGFRGDYRAPEPAAPTPVLAVDIPSGVEGDTGRAAGAPLLATRTVTFAALKPGLLQGDGPELCGEITVADIGLPVGAAGVQLMEDADVARLVAPRAHEDNKWSTAVLVVAGSPGMTGAAGMCARAALRSGAGMVRLGVPGAALGTTPAPEAVGVELPATGWSEAALAELGRCSALVIGPGIGRDPATVEEVRRLVASAPVPTVVDADGLFALGELPRAGAPLREGGAPVVLTPHGGEFRRLTGEPPGGDRVAAARRLATQAGAVALVKGSTTAVGSPDGRVLLSCAGSSRLATAGTGDVLSGVIGALLARRVPAQEAAALAAHVHGRAAGRGRAEGLVADDLPELVADELSARRGAAEARRG